MRKLIPIVLALVLTAIYIASPASVHAVGEVYEGDPLFVACTSTPTPPATTSSVLCDTPSSALLPNADGLAISSAPIPGSPLTMAANGTVRHSTSFTTSAPGLYGVTISTGAEQYVACGYLVTLVDINGDLVGDLLYQTAAVGDGDASGPVPIQRDSVVAPVSPAAFGSWTMTLVVEYVGGTVFNVACQISGAQSYQLTTSVDLASNILTEGRLFARNADVFNISGQPVGTSAGSALATFSAPYILATPPPPPILIDPSGFVFESPNTSTRIPGAVVTLEQYNGSAFVAMNPITDAPFMEPDQNPEFTDTTGRYRWDVAPGTYRVVVSKTGCAPVTSASVTVPDPVTDLNIAMTCTDADADGLKDWRETNSLVYLDGANTGTSPAKADTDNDGLSDGAEVTNGTNPLDPDMDDDTINDGSDNCVIVANGAQHNADANYIDNPAPLVEDDNTRVMSDSAGDVCDEDDDNDGLPDAAEATLPMPGCAAAAAALDPLSPDTDGDAFLDAAECAIGTNPGNASSKPTRGQCAGLAGVGPGADSDGDKLADRVELCGYGSSPAGADADGDGRRDGCEAASLNTLPAVNSLDQLLLAQAIIADLSGPFVWNADLNKDGANNSADQLLMAQIFLGGGC